jgi:SAM-dependent methyltransferase
VCDLTDSAPPSPWVVQHAPLIQPGGPVLDLAAGGGRHTHCLYQAGHPVVAIDRDVAALLARGWDSGVEILAADLEDGSPWPLEGRRFDGIVVTNYLHRPLLPRLAQALLPGGILIYETFAQGNARFGKPSNPEFLLRPGELLALADDFSLTVLGYFCGEITQPRPAMIQRMAARAPI